MNSLALTPARKRRSDVCPMCSRTGTIMVDGQAYTEDCMRTLHMFAWLRETDLEVQRAMGQRIGGCKSRRTSIKSQRAA